MAYCPFGPYRILSDFGSCDEPRMVHVLLVRLRAPSSHHDNGSGLAINIWLFAVRRLMG
jgi:hypothetical protein